MSIEYYGHCAASADEANVILRRVEEQFSADTWLTLRLFPAKPLAGPFEREIARDFGIEASSRFMLQVIDKEEAYRHLPDTHAALYRAFGTGNLVLTWHLDHVVMPPVD
jgi:hypothetical protein